MFTVGSKATGPSLCSPFHTMTPASSPWTLQPLNRPITLSDSFSWTLPYCPLGAPHHSDTLPSLSVHCTNMQALGSTAEACPVL